MVTFLKKGLLSLIIVLTQFACVQAIPEYRFTSDYTSEKLELDKEACRSAQAAAGNYEENIGKCLEAKGWVVLEKKEPRENISASEE